MARPLRPQPLWVRIDQNRFKLAAFTTTFVVGSALLLTLAFVGVPGALVGGALVWSGGAAVSEVVRVVSWWFAGVLAAFLLLGGIASAVQLSNAEDWVKVRFRAAELDPGAEPRLERVVAEMSLAAGLSDSLHVLVIETDSVNAGVVGLSRSSAAFVITRGMLERFDDGQLRAVVATLMARVVSGDVLYGTALAALMGPLKMLREWKAGTTAVGSTLSDGCATDGCIGDGCSTDGCGCLFDALDDSDSASGCGAAIAMVVFAVVVAAITYAAVVSAAWIVTIWGRMLHRTSHEKADAEGMLLLKDPAPMLSALYAAITSSNLIGDGDASYDGIFYVQTSGAASVEKAERRRYDRLREVLGTEGLATPL